MLRDRYRRSLKNNRPANNSRGWLLLPWSSVPMLLRKKTTSTTELLVVNDAAAVIGVERDAEEHGGAERTAGVVEVELAEVGRAGGGGGGGRDFRRAVLAVVELEEEGLFRNIVTYL